MESVFCAAAFPGLLYWFSEFLSLHAVAVAVCASHNIGGFSQSSVTDLDFHPGRPEEALEL